MKSYSAVCGLEGKGHQQALLALTSWKDRATKRVDSELSKGGADELERAGDFHVVSLGDFATLALEARRHQGVLSELAARKHAQPPPTAEKKAIGKVPPLAATWIQYLLGFGVSVAVGLAPYLGKIHVPLFQPMLSFIPPSLQDIAIPVSSAAMGIVAVAVQWFGLERLSTTWLRAKFRQAVFLCVLTLAGLTAIETLAVVRVDVPAVHDHVSFATGFSYPNDPPCEGIGREACIYRLSLDESKINPFFGELGVNLTKLILVLTYTVFMSTFGCLVGLAVLKGRLGASPIPEGSAELEAPDELNKELAQRGRGAALASKPASVPLVEGRFRPSDLEKRLRSVRWLGWAAPIAALLIAAGVFVLRSSGSVHKPNPSAISHYERNDHNDRVIVFVHGIFGDSLDTWRCASTRMYWPSKLLTEDAFKGFDVYVASYESPYFGNQMTIDEIVGNLQNRLQHDKVFDHKEVVFVAHSLGGLIVQRFLLTHREYAKQVPFIYFYSTPETGAEIARLGSLFSSDPLLKQMFPGEANDYLLNLEAEWKAAGFTNIHRYCAYESLRTSAKSNLLNPVRFGQLTHEPAAGTRASSCLSNGTDASCSRMFDSIQAASSRTGIRTCELPSLVHMPRKAAANASCCCEAWSLAINRAWPMVISSFRKASAKGGIRSANFSRP